MAIIANVVTETGAIFPQQYIRVDNVTAHKDRVSIFAGIYMNEELKNTPPHRAEILYGEFDLYSELNLWEQAYIAIKQMWPEYTDA